MIIYNTSSEIILVVIRLQGYIQLGGGAILPEIVVIVLIDPSAIILFTTGTKERKKKQKLLTDLIKFSGTTKYHVLNNRIS